MSESTNTGGSTAAVDVAARVSRDDNARAEKLAAVIQVPEGHDYGVTARMDKDGKVTVVVFACVDFDSDPDDGTGEAVHEGLSVSVEVEAPASLVNALEKVVNDNKDALLRQTRLGVARHMMAVGV